MARLSREALLGVAKAHILREGTEYGHRDFDLSEKLESVLTQLKNGKAVLVYSDLDECCHVLLREEWIQYQRSAGLPSIAPLPDENSTVSSDS